MTTSAEQIITIASVIGAVTGLYALFSKPFKTLDRIDKSVSQMGKAVELHGDMIAELLDHAITNNNTGKMADVKKRYDEAYRHDINEG